MLKKIFLAIIFLSNSLLITGQNGLDFYDYNSINDTLNKILNGELTISDKSQELSLYKKAAIYNRSLFAVIGYEYLKMGKKNNAIKSYKKWVYNGGDISYIQDSSVLKVINYKYPKWRKQYIKRSEKYKSIRETMENIRTNDQAYRKYIKIYRGSLEEIDKKTLDSLWVLQKNLDSINRINIYKFKNDILNNYYDAASIYETTFHSIPAILSHYSEKDNLHFLSDMEKYAKEGKCDWSLALSTMVFLSFKYSYKIDNDTFYVALRKVIIDSNNHLNIQASALQLEAMQNFLNDNSNYNAVLFSFFDTHKIALQDIMQFLINKGVSAKRLQIDTDIHTPINGESIFGWKIFSK